MCETVNRKIKEDSAAYDDRQEWGHKEISYGLERGPLKPESAGGVLKDDYHRNPPFDEIPCSTKRLNEIGESVTQWESHPGSGHRKARGSVRTGGSRDEEST